METQDLSGLLREAEEHHGPYEAEAPKHHWSGFYAAYVVARDDGRSPEEADEDARRYMAEVEGVVVAVMNATALSASNNGRGSDAWSRPWTHLRIDRRSPGYCRVTFDHPPINTITATTVAELAELVGLIEEDPDLNVVVFDSANPDFYLAHYDVENDPARTAALGVGPTGMPAWIDVLVRLARAPVVSIASIRDAPAAPEASSCSPATCGSPRARTRCSASSRSASASSRAAVRWPGSPAWSAAAARSRSSSSPTISTGRARSSTGMSTG